MSALKEFFEQAIAARLRAKGVCASCGGSGQIRDDVFNRLWPCLMCREDDNPAQQKRGCQVCHCCKTKNPFGCSRNADQSQIDAVVASFNSTLVRFKLLTVERTTDKTLWVKIYNTSDKFRRRDGQSMTNDCTWKLAEPTEERIQAIKDHDERKQMLKRLRNQDWSKVSVGQLRKVCAALDEQQAKV